MKRVLAILAGLIFLVVAQAQQYIPSDESSDIKFTIKNFGLSTTGTFKGLEGIIFFTPDNLSECHFNVGINPATIKTGIDARDSHLKKKEYFDTKHYVDISFNSTKVAGINDKESYIVSGKLTIKGITKEISFPFTAENRENGIIFNGKFKLSRRDFNVGSSSLVLSDSLEISLNVFAKKS